MNSGGQRKSNDSMINQPWWLRVLEHQGIATLFALILLGAGWRVAEVHLRFIEGQSAQMALQTHALSTISQSMARQESTIGTAIQESKRNHADLMEAVRELKK